MHSTQEIQSLTTRRYLTDPEFHARVQVAYTMANELCVAQTGRGMTAEEKTGVVLAACCALLVSELPAESIPGDEDYWFEQMKVAAEALGMTVVRTSE